MNTNSDNQHIDDAPSATFLDECGFVLRVELENLYPVVWRRILIPCSTTLDRLHLILQVIMGWSDSHLHSFNINQREFSDYVDKEWLNEFFPEDGVALNSLVQSVGASFFYVYDFGDNWSHKITIESVQLTGNRESRIAWCIEGEYRSPPEDVGGVDGYIEFRVAMKDRYNPWHKGYVRWFGGKYDEEDFDRNAVNNQLSSDV